MPASSPFQPSGLISRIASYYAASSKTKVRCITSPLAVPDSGNSGFLDGQDKIIRERFLLFRNDEERLLGGYSR
jgi:hypothetical protein